MFHQQQEIILYFAANSPLTEIALKLEHLRIGPPSEVLHQQAAAHAPAPRRRALRASTTPSTTVRARRTSSPDLPRSWCTGIQTSINNTVANPETIASPPRR